ncbi:sulfite exporter TauE/SafE family protein [Flavobacterium sp. LPB0248]|uniref:sulfite exporter TauE/SafE family protein n=1 Tax=Flavobacterium sp. LPB0248 TaxID=2614441 RepID=UPI0015A5A6FA|nr:sulfite exporter TauE/SafE family protein [Flavobacterium sp. LPB0248]QLC64833.1 sulfite exporter TauE/SafE family protein [Flavobacterium sp. LPB0248]
MVTSLVIIFICSFLAFAISAICGGGAGLMLIPILGALLPMNQVPAALSIGTFTSSASRIILFKKNICWHIVKYFVPAAIPAVWLGAWLLKFLNPLYLEIAMGLFLISNLPFIFKKPAEINAGEKTANWLLCLIGFSAGFLSGLTGVVGLLFNKFYLRYGLSKEEIVATRAANEIILHLIKIVLYTLFGLISMKVISIGVVVAVAAILSSLSMKWILPKLSEFVFKKIGYYAMVLSGFVILGKTTSTLAMEKGGNFTATTMSKGIEAKLKWQNARFAMEFTYDEGFEFEQIIPMKDLTAEQQSLVKSKSNNADKIIIEAVYAINKRSYEAYYFKNNKLIHKIDFE